MRPGGVVEIIMGKRKPSPAEEASEGEGLGKDADMQEGLEAMFEEIAKAVKEGDAKAGAEALHSFVQMCGAYE